MNFELRCGGLKCNRYDCRDCYPVGHPSCLNCVHEDEDGDGPICKPCGRSTFGTGECRYSPKIETPGIGHNGGPPLDDTLSLPDDDAVRGDFPMFDGLLAYFPNALAEVSKVSKIGNDQHNPGQTMHWARDKSLDHENKIMRHLVDAGKLDGRGVRHTARLAWRALAMLQEELERAEGLPPSRASKNRPF